MCTRAMRGVCLLGVRDDTNVMYKSEGEKNMRGHLKASTVRMEPDSDPDLETEEDTRTRASPTRHWMHSPFDVLGDCRVTIPACVVPLSPWLYSAIAKQLNYFPIGGSPRSFLVCVSMLVFIELVFQVALGAYKIATGASPMCSSGVVCATEYVVDAITIVTSLFLCALVVVLRHRARSDRSIEYRCVAEEDVCLSLWCLPCSLIQLGREVDAGAEVVYCALPTEAPARPAPAQPPLRGPALEI